MGKTNNVESLVNRTTVQGSGATQSQGFVSHPFSDASGAYPFANEEGKPVTTQGGQLINTYGADVPDDTIQGNNPGTASCYTHTTPAGHTIEYNDTPGSERIMIRHMNGDGINIGPDGSIIISGKRRIDKAQEDYFLEVKNGTMKFEGNLTLDVTGDFNVNVGGEYNVNSAKKTEVVKKGPYTRTITGDDIKTVDGNQTNLVNKGGAHQYLEGLSTIVKGESRYIVEGPHTEAVSGVLTMTSEEEVILTSPEANIAADNLSVFGDTGTIGGENMQMYTMNLRAGGTVYADVSMDTPKGNITRVEGTSAHYTTFHGDLNGTAKQSNITAAQNYPDTDPGGNTSGSAYSYTSNSADDLANNTTATAKPTATLLTDYRTKSDKGVRVVKVDPEDIQKNNVDLSKKTSGVTNKNIDVAQVRRKMRDPAHRDNVEFTTLMLSEGKLSPDYANTSPPNVETIQDTETLVVQGSSVIGNPSPHLTSKRIIR
jgi:hypothetical protein